jgi:uncharacterized protein (TIGR01244 family)
MTSRPVTPNLTIADQPDEADLAALAAQGCIAVVNLRTAGEPEQPLGPAEEGDAVRNLGMDYLHQPVGSDPLTPEGVGAVLDFLDAHVGGPVLVHCRKGGRAAALVLLHQARARGWPASEVFERGRALGLNVEGPLRAKIEQYLAQNQS